MPNYKSPLAVIAINEQAPLFPIYKHSSEHNVIFPFIPGNALDGAAETMLHAAAWEGDVAQARALIEKGAQVNHVDSAGETALHGAAASGHAAMVLFLLSQGAQPDIQETLGLTALHWATSHGDLATVQVLIAGGANARLLNNNGQSAHELARIRQRIDIAHYLEAHTKPVDP